MDTMRAGVAADPTTPATVAPGTRPDAARRDGYGGLAVLELVAWSVAVLLAATVLLAVVLLLVEGAAPGVGTEAYLLLWASAAAPVPAVVLGWPIGVLLARALRREPSERRHVLVFALVGALTAVLLAHLGRVELLPPGVVLVFAAEGALAAGGGRLLVGITHRRRAARRARPAATAGAPAAVTP